MGSIFIMCPQTKQPAYTGIEIGREAFSMLPRLSAVMRCPACGGRHTWKTTTALLLERDSAGALLGDARPNYVTGAAVKRTMRPSKQRVA